MVARETDRKIDAGVGEEVVFKAAKEIAVKFIEVGKLSPGDFDDVFSRVYRSLRGAVRAK